MKQLIIAIILLTSLTTKAQKQKDTTSKKPISLEQKITDSMPLISIQDMNRYLSTLDTKTITVYELELLKKSFQALVDIGFRNFYERQKTKK